MSYCVNCGVELDKSAKKCALCNTPVYNPNINTEEKDIIAPFSRQTHIPEELPSHVKKRILILTVSMIMLIPNLVCIILNFTLFKDSLWSAGIAATSLFLWSAFVFPFCTKKPMPYVLWASNSIMACATALVYAWILGGDKTLFTDCLLPMTLVVSAVCLAYIIWYKKQRHIILKLAFVFLGLSVISGGFILAFYSVIPVVMQIGIICGVSSFALFGFFLYCYSSKTIRRWASKRFFV